MQSPKSRQPRHQKALREGRRHTQDDAPFSPASRHPLDAERDHCQRFGDVGQEMAARGCERDAARPALEQLHAEPFLERVDAVADGARSQTKLVRGFGEAFVPGGGFKQPEWRERWNRDRHLGRLARNRGGEAQNDTRLRVEQLECAARDHCGWRPEDAQSGRVRHSPTGHWSNLSRNSRTMRTTASGCSMKGMWPAPGMTTSLAPAMRAAIRSLNSFGMS